MPKKVVLNPQERLVHFIIDLLNASRPIEFSRYEDEEEWGDERTFRRLRALINQVWERRNQTPLFEIVDADGRVKQRGDGRFIKLVDKSLQTGRVERMAVMPAVMQMLQTLKGTILHEEFSPLYKSWYADLKGNAKKHFDRTEKKFYCFSKGAKRYDRPERTEVLEEIYDALLKEQLLQIRYVSKGDEKESVVEPLSLVMFNTGLYLLCHFQYQDGDRVYSFALETIRSAKSMRGKHFVYPMSFHPEKHFDGDFGFIRFSEKRYVVILEYAVSSWVRSYLRERRWTGNERYESMNDGKERFHMDVSDLREVVPWLLPLCDEALVVGCNELKEELKKKLAAIRRLNA